MKAAEENEFVRFWNETLAGKFERHQEILMNGLSYHSRVPLERLELAPGSRVVDVGCGWGDTAIDLARKTGPTGFVLGLDCVDRFLERGRRDAAAAGLENVQFLAADVQSHPFEPEFDLAFSRFGMMFFENPVAAMRNVRTALRPGGWLLMIVWRHIEENPWLGLPKQVLLELLPPIEEPVQSCGPGPFSMADRDLVTAQLGSAGFEDVTFEQIDGPVTVGASVEDAIDFQLAIGPAGERFREAGEEAERRRDEVDRALNEVLTPYLRPEGIVMPSSSWAIRARNPA